ncbi:Auxin-responsive protein SAUR41 [Hibiscus syriacus]|uniref:Auxin-responsive protein SAUR41 n=1 Tax=Hibiscus syriacus TaxID=106335 RepID=A0A6A2YJF2_HIBSY|nr:auxin-responsive protein SAUR72-like [Hibiscus syriacus]KAE8679219.1 Auxin-responsive protein SAUR41 [Hibiscus syriacus]
MKQLIRRLSRVADTSSQYRLLRSDTSTDTRRTESFRVAVSFSKKPGRLTVPEGHVPVYVGEDMERFVVSAELLNHPVFVGLLNKSAQEYGYEQKGVLHIPCHVLVFERVMEALRLGVSSHDLQDLLRSFSDDCFFISRMKKTVLRCRF